MTVTQFLLLFSASAGPWLVALMRRRSMSDDLVRAGAIVFAALCFVVGQFADGALSWPLTSDFLTGLAAAVGLQQVGYSVYKRVAPDALQKAEEL